MRNIIISKKTGERIMLNIGDRAPGFTLKDKKGNDVSLSDFIGKKVVLYFYPKDNTPGVHKTGMRICRSIRRIPKKRSRGYWNQS